MDTGEHIRCFIAVEMNSEARRGLAAAISQLNGADANVKWVDPENAHLTLVFLGDIPTLAATRIKNQLDTIAGRIPPISMEVVGLGTFSNRQALRVIWAGITTEDDSLLKLQAQLCATATAQGIQVDDRPFNPHVTIGRVRSRHGTDTLAAMIESRADTRLGHIDVARIVMMQSVLTPIGPNYSILHESPLLGKSRG